VLSRDLPPLHLLTAFEAAGRLGSFKEAARELHVTPSAISQQIRALEQALGISLFQRHSRAVALTASGKGFFEDVRHVLLDLASAARRARRGVRRESFRISTIDFLAYEFLLPRLSAFRQRFPGVELSFETGMQLVDFDSSDIDAAIRVGGGPWDGLTSTPVGGVHVAVVCNRKLARQVRTEQQVFEHTLIELRGQEYRGWTAVLRERGVPASKMNILRFESYFETMLAAEQGLGLAFGLFPISVDWVLSGRLSVPLAVRTELPGQVCLVHRPRPDEQEFFAAFASWLREQYEELPSLPAGRIVNTSPAAGARARKR